MRSTLVLHLLCYACYLQKCRVLAILSGRGLIGAFCSLQHARCLEHPVHEQYL